MTTERQKKAVRFCETWTDNVFEEDINDFNAVSASLAENLDNAKCIADELQGLTLDDIC